jgi:recombination protein RecT
MTTTTKKTEAAAPAAPPKQEATPQPVQQEPQQPVTERPKAAQEAKGIDQFSGIKERCVELFGTEVRFVQEATFLLRMVNDTPALQECSKASIAGVLLSIASTGLSLNPVLKLCYVIPRNVKVKTASGDRWEKRANVEPSYMGLMKLATDTGAVKNFEVHEVYKGDEFEFDLVAKRPRVHKPYWTLGRERGPMVGVYGFAVLADGTTLPEHMGADELSKIQAKSDNAGGKVYADWQGEMARKSLVKRLQKYIPRTEGAERFLKAVDLDNQGFELLPERASASAEAIELENLKADVRAAMDTYAGDDRLKLRKACADEVMSGRRNPQFWKDMLTQLRAQ